MTILYLGNPALRRISKAVSDPKSPAIHSIFKTMRQQVKMEEGVGLAAPQVGHNLRMFLMMKDLPDEKKVLEYQEVINPVILQASKETNLDFEGCLSIPEYVGIVRRSNEIEVQYQDLHDQVHRHFLKDFPARIFQHELDHLNGILYIDKMKHKSLIHHKEFEQLEWEQINKLLV